MSKEVTQPLGDDGPNILFADIETTPLIGPAWKVYDTSLMRVLSESYILCATYAKGDGPVEFIRKARDKRPNDKALTKRLADLMEWADIIVAHNGNQFDIKRIQDRMLFWDIPPVSGFQTVDTLLASRAKFGRHSHSLKSLAITHKLTLKESNSGIGLWLDCMANDPDAWAEMERYARGDIVTLREWYYKLRPWITNHPNMGHWIDGNVCRNCGSADLIKWGYHRTNASTFQRYRCKNCRSTHTRDKSRMGEPWLR